MDNQIIKKTDIDKIMKTAYIDYAMSVIIQRALPDVRDGLKPVQRRILYAMLGVDNIASKPYRKCAKTVGETMSKYHPHGDSSIYGALVNMAQDWATRYPLIDKHGNFGSIDGDGAAAMRYTESRLSKISMELLADINKDTVDFVPNFDETEKEPVVLPAKLPNILLNGSTGIAVGMATSIPPHNLHEIVNGVIKIIDNDIENKETNIDELLSIVKGPDFPTGATIKGISGIKDAYKTGRGKVTVRSVTNIEEMSNGKHKIIVTEIPYMVNKAKLIEKIAELVKDKKIVGITDLRDESNKDGIRICIELKKDANPNIILNQLYKHTNLQTTFSIIMLVILNNEPKIMNLYEILRSYLTHQEEIVTRRTKFELNKALNRKLVVEGLLIAIDNIDDIVHISKTSKTVTEIKDRLNEKYNLVDAQSLAIAEMRLKSLARLEVDTLKNELKDLIEKVAYLENILNNHNVLLEIIKEEILELSKKYSDERKTKIEVDNADVFEMEDLIKEEDTVIAFTNLGYIKRMALDNFKSQNRGGKGIVGMNTLEEDYIEDLLMATTHDYIMFFTNLGRVYRLKVYEIPESSRTARGTAIINLLNLQNDEKITAIISFKKYNDEKSLIFATKRGVVKKLPLNDLENIRKSGTRAIILKEDDELIEVKIAKKDNKIIMVSKKGNCIVFDENEVGKRGRNSGGVIGIKISNNDEIVGMQISNQGTDVFTITENGLGKRTDLSEFNIIHRAGKGVKCHKITEKSGDIVSFKLLNEEDEILVMTDDGVIIRLKLSDISKMGRVTQGVKIINLSNNKVARVTKVRETVENN